MEDTGEDMGIDPAIAAAMGFSGFGAKPGDKRKYNSNDGYVDPAITSQAQTTASMPSNTSKATRLPSKPANAFENSKDTDVATASKNPSEATLEELKNGVRNERGDMVYFMPSFLEDPWKDLKPK